MAPMGSHILCEIVIVIDCFTFILPCYDFEFILMSSIYYLFCGTSHSLDAGAMSKNISTVNLPHEGTVSWHKSWHPTMLRVSVCSDFFRLLTKR